MKIIKQENKCQKSEERKKTRKKDTEGKREKNMDEWSIKMYILYYIVLYPIFVAHYHCDLDSASVVNLALLYFMLCQPLK